MTHDQATVAFLGLAGWYEKGRSSYNSTYTRSGGLREDELTAPLRVDLRPLFEGRDLAENIVKVWARPTLDLMLPAGNVRSLFEGCIGHEGTLEGHPWDGDFGSLVGTDSVGLDVYLALLVAQGAKVERVDPCF